MGTQWQIMFRLLFPLFVSVILLHKDLSGVQNLHCALIRAKNEHPTQDTSGFDSFHWKNQFAIRSDRSFQTESFLHDFSVSKTLSVYIKTED